MSSEPVIIVHGADSDGLVSATLLLDHLGRGEVWFADYDNLTEVFEVAARLESTQPIHYADLALRVPAIPDQLVLTLTTDREVRGYDHHEIGEAARRTLLRERLTSFVHVVGGSCASRLIIEHLGISGEQHCLMADAAQGSDYWGSVPSEVEALGRALDRLIWEMDRAAIVEALARGLQYPETHPWQRDHQLAGVLGQAHERAMGRTGQALEQLKGNVTYHLVGGIQVACTMAADLLYPKEGLHALESCCPEAELRVVFYNGTTAMLAALSASGQACGVPLVAFLTSMGGGGRNDKGGLRFPEVNTDDNYPQRRDALLAALDRFVSGRE